MPLLLRLTLPAVLLPLLLAAGPAASLVITFEEPAGLYDPDHPGGGEHGPYDWIEAGARYSGFWLTQVGTPDGGSQIGHTHLASTIYSGHIGDQPHSWVGDLQGGVVSLIGGGAFDVVSIDYRIVSRETPPNVDPWTYFEQRLPWSRPVEDVHLLLATEVDPAAPDFATFESQFTAFDIDDGSVLDLGGGEVDWRRPAAEVPQRTLTVSGFENVTEFYITHTGNYVVIDDIVIVPHAVAVPEPGSATLVALGLGILALPGRGGTTMRRVIGSGRRARSPSARGGPAEPAPRRAGPVG